jgi:energy-converting hydrogenase Eha subunit E
MKRLTTTWMGLVAVAASSALVLGACGGGRDAARQHSATVPGNASNPASAASGSSCVATGPMLADIRSYAGKQITVTGTVGQVIGQNVFTVVLEGNNSGGVLDNASKGQTLLAVEEETLPFTPGTPVQVTGILQPTFSIGVLPPTLDTDQTSASTGATFDRAALTAYDGKPYVHAAFVGLISANLITKSSGFPSGGNSVNNNCAEVSVVLHDTRSYAGKQVTVTGTVATIIGPHAFTVAANNGGRKSLTDGNNDNTQTLLTLDKTDQFRTAGSPIEVTGVLQATYDAHQAQAFAEHDLDEAELIAYNGKPYIQAVFAGPVSANLTSNGS